MRTLQDYEDTGEIEPLVALFNGQAELEKLASKTPSCGQEGARQFWQLYLANFQQVRSTFTHVMKGPDGIVLEWDSEGARPDGTPVRYRGVSILELDGEKVSRFRTYYDTAAFLAHSR
jgi:ketosteroid isomerase-like protein